MRQLTDWNVYAARTLIRLGCFDVHIQYRWFRYDAAEINKQGEHWSCKRSQVY